MLLLIVDLKHGVDQAISSSVELGKSTIGIVSGKFESVEQAHNAIKNGGIIDSISDALECAINKACEFNKINDSLGYKLKKGKNIIMDNIKSNIENNFSRQIVNLEKLNSYMEKWEKYYKEKNFEKMNYEYKQIKSIEQEIFPIEETIKKLKEIENINELIKNKGKNFSLSDNEIKLAEKLAI